MKLIIILILSLLLSACDPIPHSPQHQSRFICQALIQGYLKAQQLGQYELHHQIDQINGTRYIYQKPTTSGLILGIPPLQQITFECSQKTQNRYQVFIITPSLLKTAVLNFHAVYPI